MMGTLLRKLHGLDQALKAAWAPGLTKQEVFRRALESLGAGDVATNTTAFRLALGAAVKRCWPEGKNFASRAAPCVVPQCAFVPSSRPPLPVDWRAARAEFRRTGLCVLRRAVDASLVLAEINAAAPPQTPTLLRPTTGNGAHGAYAYFVPGAPVLALRDDVAKAFQLDALAVSRSRFIAIRYGEGGVNYAHQDQAELAIQASILLSRPGLDFDGGEFFLKNLQTGETTTAACGEAGDVVVFQAAGDYAHGIRPVRRGTDRAERFAVGVFQPPAPGAGGGLSKRKRRASDHTTRPRRRR